MPDIGHVEVANPEAGTWTAQIKWANGRAHLQSLPNVPGTYRGTVSFRASGQNWITSPAVADDHDRGARLGDDPAAGGVPDRSGRPPRVGAVRRRQRRQDARSRSPAARSSRAPAASSTRPITGSVGRGIGQISTFNINVPAGRADLGVTVRTPDTSTDDPMRLFLVNPARRRARTQTSLTVADDQRRADAGGHVPRRQPDGRARGRSTPSSTCTTSGKEFRQTIVGDVLPQAPAITSPAAGASPTSTMPVISGTGTPGDTVTVSNGATVVCTAVVAADGTWSCTPALALPAGAVTLTATQADQTGNPSAASAPVAITVPLGRDEHHGHGRRHDAGDAGADARRPASFAPFTPGVAQDYTASTTADGDVQRRRRGADVVDPSRLLRATWSTARSRCRRPCRPLAVSVGAVSRSPPTLKSWSAPVSNDPVTVGFTQSIGANDALRTGSYSKTLTFTLSTTQP